MRLLHTEKLTFQEFEGATVPKYAILSHRWDDAEISYQDYCQGKATSGPGYSKILEFCKLAQSRGHKWAWIDTCCIDKRSSAELTESINSMWTWYSNSVECYAYLADVPHWVHRWLTHIDGRQSLQFDAKSLASFQRSDWFARGWTLQELIAPSEVFFCTSDWRVLGSKNELTQELSRITGIRARYLSSPARAREASIAMRMSWASQRVTTRVEDIAYCLLGLFDVNMSMLYGEGGIEAFMRLQRKIIKKYDDESIFAWAKPKNDALGPAGMLATSPSAFKQARNVVTLDIPPEQRLKYQMTNKGLELKIPSSIRKPVTDKTSNIPSQAPKKRPESWKYLSESYASTWQHDSYRPGRFGGYAPLETKAPSDKNWKRLQLACAFLRQDTSGPVDPSKYPAGAISVIEIMLTRTDHGWKRLRCNQFATQPKFREIDGFSRSVYYVTQGESPQQSVSVARAPAPSLSIDNSITLGASFNEYEDPQHDSNANKDDGQSCLRSNLTDGKKLTSVPIRSKDTVSDTVDEQDYIIY